MGDALTTFQLSTTAAALVIALAGVPVVAAGDAVPATDLARWGDELSSDEFQVRQNAMRRLIEAGSDALPMLARAARDGDTEVRRRAIRALVEQSLVPRQEHRQPARAMLAELAASDDGTVARSAQNALDSLREAAAAVAAAELTRLGGTVMPQTTAFPTQYKVQLGQSWSGGDAGLALLADLGDVTWLSIENAPVGDAALKHIARLTALQTVYLGHSRLTGNGLAQLAPLSSLRYLSLRNLPIDETHLAELPRFPQLISLGLDRTLVTDAGLAHVARHQHLQQLWLDATRITDKGLARLRPLADLRTLYVPETKVAGPGLAELRHLPSLRYLSLRGIRFDAEAVKHLGRVTQLESLGLDDTNLGDDQIAGLTSLSQLRVLWLSATPLTDAGLQQLQGLSKLQIVYLSGTQVSPKAIADLKRALPQAQFSQ
jgi:hypothetical protein